MNVVQPNSPLARRRRRTGADNKTRADLKYSKPHGIFFSLTGDGGGCGDADALVNVLPHSVQNEVLVAFAVPQYLQYFCCSICVSKLVTEK